MKIFIVEDNEELLSYLQHIFNKDIRFYIVGSATNAEDVLLLFGKANPDLVIVDIDLPGASGIDLLKELKALSSNVKALAYTGKEDRKTVIEAFRCGMDGYILKGGFPAELLQACVDIMEGGAPMSSRVASFFLENFRTEDCQYVECLGIRENEVMQHLSNGLTYKEIASKLDISPHTVRTHIKNIYEKLGARSRIEAINIAKENMI